MTTFKRTNNSRLGLVLPVLLAFSLGACGGGGGGSDDDNTTTTTTTTTTPTTDVSGGGVKGPLANAIVTVYAFDPTQPGFKGADIATATTNAAAQIVGLALPFPVTPPYIMEFTSDAGTTDITTGAAPVITTMRTVITQSLLDSGEQIYATPLTTMAVDIAIAKSTPTTTAALFEAALTAAAADVVSTLGFGMDSSIDIFDTPPLVDSTTDSAAAQADVAAYRTAVEAVTAIAFQINQQTADGNTDSVLAELSADLADGGGIDGSAGDQINANTLQVFEQDPATLPIPRSGGPGGAQTVGDVQAILVAETATTGTTTSTTELDAGGSITTEAEPAETNPDSDNDGTLNIDDAFPDDPNETSDADGDGIGDNADPDDNNNGILDVDEGQTPTPVANDADLDGFEDSADNCPAIFNPSQNDLDGDEVPGTGGGDACDDDIDGDTVLNGNDAFPLIFGESVDTDGDGVGNNTDADDDNDGVADTADLGEAPSGPFAGTNCSLLRDCDGDGVFDGADFAPTDPAVTSNFAPVAASSSVSTDEDQAVAATLSVTDDGVAPGALTYNILTGPSNGTLDGTAPNLTYTPAGDFSGTDSFTFNAEDSDNAQSSTATVSITVAAVNDPPVAGDDDAGSTNEDTPKTGISVLGNDTDIEGDSLSVAAGNPVAGNGTVVNNNDGTFDYTPNADFNGTDSFDYVVLDGNGGSDTGTVTINVAAVNDAPFAVDDDEGTAEDTPVTTANVLTNDSDIDGDALSVAAGNPSASNGTVVNNNNGTFDYTPNANFFGADSFTYTVIDGNTGADTGTVNITVSSVNDLPIGNADAFAAGVLNPTVLDVLANDSDVDGDTLTITGVSQGSLGSTVSTDGSSVTFTDVNNSAPNDETFTYDLFDGTATVSGIVVTVSVSVNVPPVANPDAATTDEEVGVVTGNVLTNDTDGGDGPAALSITAADAASVNGGTVVNNGNGTFNYTPATDFNGLDSFTYTVSDGASTTVGTVNITVNPINDDPVTVNDNESTDEDTPVTTANVLTNDSDIDGDTLSVAAGNPAASSGSVVNNNDGTFEYTPNTNFNGQDSFDYTVNDGNGGSDIGTVTIDVAPVNDQPVAGDDTAITIEDTPVTTGDVLTNDSDIDGDTLSVAAGNPTATNGTVVNNNDGTFDYTPNADFNGQDSFDYTVLDGNGLSDTGTVTVTVGAANDAPVAVDDDAGSTNEDTPFTTPDVLGNDTDAEGDTLSVAAGNPIATNGSVVNNNNGTFDYTPNADYNGPDSFDYVVNDGNGGFDTGTVSIIVNPVNDNPVATDDNDSTAEETLLTTVNVLLNDNDVDGDTLSVQTGNPVAANGTVVNNNNGTFDYTPNTNFTGTDSFDYTLIDNNGGSDTGTVFINVTGINDNPIAVNDDESTDEDTLLTTANVLANDTDPDGDILFLSGVDSTSSNGGTVVNNNDGSFNYTPPLNFSGDDSFNYGINDGNGGTASGSVNITVNPVNDPPTAVDDNETVAEDSILFSAPVTGNDIDVDGDTLTIFASDTSSAAGGSVEHLGGGSFRYTPPGNFNGVDSFNYTATDGLLTSAATVTITVTPENDPPVAVDDSDNAIVNTVLTTINVLGNDTDIDGDTLFVTAGNPAATNGTVVNNNDGTFDYTPNTDYQGPDSFDYTVNDGNGGSDTGTVFIDVTVYPTAVISELFDPAIGGGAGALESGDFGQVFPEFSYFKDLYNPVANIFSFEEKDYRYPTQNFVNTQNFGEEDQFLKADGSWVSFNNVTLEFSTVNHGDGSASLSIIDSSDSEELGRLRISALTDDISGELIADHLDPLWAAQMIDPSAVFGPGALRLIDYFFDPEVDFYEMETSTFCDSSTLALLGGNCEGVRIDDFGNYAFTLDQIIQVTPWVDPDDFTQTGLVRVHVSDNGSESLFAELIMSGNTVNYYVVDHFAGNAADAVTLALADAGAWVRDSTIKNTEMLRFTVPASFVGQFPELTDIGDRRRYLAVNDGAVRSIYPSLVGDTELAEIEHLNGIAIDQVLANFNPPPVPDFSPLVGTWVADVPSSNGDPVTLQVFENGYFENSGTCDLDGTTGLDYGQFNFDFEADSYAWNSVSGKFNAFSFISTRGLCGTSQRAFLGDTMLVNGDVLTANLAGIGDVTFHRMHRDSNPLVGSWILGDIDAWGEGHAIITFYDDTQFSLSQNCDSEGQTGFEFGTYSWDQGGTLDFSGNLSIDTNGGCGVHDNTGLAFSGIQITHNGDFITLSSIDGAFDFWRHSDDTLACSYESGWDDIAGEPLVFNSYIEFQQVANSCGGVIPVVEADLNGSSWADTFVDNGDTIVETVTFKSDGTADITEAVNGGPPSLLETVNWTIDNNYVVLSKTGVFVDVWAFTPSGIKVYTEEADWSSAPDLGTLDGSLEGEIWTGNYVNSENVAPIANPDAATTDEDVPVTTGNLLANDTDFDSGPSALSITAFDAASANGGTVSDNGDGTYDYSPAADFNGPDSFSYTISDGTDTATGTVTITVNPVNDGPVIAQGGPLAVTLDEDNTPLAFIAPTISASDIDSGTLVWSGTSAAKGTATVSGVGSSPTVTYVADPDANGSDSFDVIVNDGDGASDSITVNITITPVNDLPAIIGTPQIIATDGVPYSFTPIATDPDGQTFVFSIVNLPVWADFDTSTGTLSGTPALSDVGGDFSGIVISVTTGTDKADLPAFAIAVSASTGLGAVWDQFNWDDGSTLQ